MDFAHHCASSWRYSSRGDISSPCGTELLQLARWELSHCGYPPLSPVMACAIPKRGPMLRSHHPEASTQTRAACWLALPSDRCQHRGGLAARRRRRRRRRRRPPRIQTQPAAAAAAGSQPAFAGRETRCLLPVSFLRATVLFPIPIGFQLSLSENSFISTSASFF